LNGIPITLPPLRERKADIAPLARHFAARTCEALGRAAVRLSPAAIEALERHVWPGNVRELKNVVDRAVVLCKHENLDVNHLVTADAESFGGNGADGTSFESPRGLKKELKSLEKKRIVDALEATAGNQTRAAKLLGMSRYTLMSRIEEYGLARPRKHTGPLRRRS
jgi:DNA-binding NtrC family response regulator